VNGYQLKYSTSRKFTGKTTKTVTVRKAAITKKTVKKLRVGKRYYFKVRTFTNVYNPATGKYVKAYGKWSKIKSIRIRK
jgi:hypothetical protein